MDVVGEAVGEDDGPAGGGAEVEVVHLEELGGDRLHGGKGEQEEEDW